MKVLHGLIICIAALISFVVVSLCITWILTVPDALAEGSVSASRLAPGPFSVGEIELTWIDDSRPTASNGDYPGSTQRTFPVTMWYPQDASGKHSLAVYSHGFVSNRRGGAYLAEHLASYGYVVVSADFPLTNIDAPGGPNLEDVVSQPTDVSFLIDQTLDLVDAMSPFDGEIDINRIGVFGLSLGAITSTLVAYHPEWRDSRVAAVISIAGVGDVFGPRFFDHATIPFLMIAGTADAIVDYETNAVPIPDRAQVGGLVIIAGATHVGFDDIATGLMRLFGNPDEVGCWLGGADPEVSLENPFSGLLGKPEQGLLEVSEYSTPCIKSFESTMSAGRQQMLTILIVRAFFESHFALDLDSRTENEEFLVRVLPLEVADVTYTPSRR